MKRSRYSFRRLVGAHKGFRKVRRGGMWKAYQRASRKGFNRMGF